MMLCHGAKANAPARATAARPTERPLVTTRNVASPSALSIHFAAMPSGTTFAPMRRRTAALFATVATVSTCNDGDPETGEADFDTKVAAYEGCECPAGNDTLVGCNDDGSGCTDFSTIMEFSAAEGTCYTIRVGGFGGASGTGVLAVSCED